MGTVANLKVNETMVVIEKKRWFETFSGRCKPVAMGLIKKIGKTYYTLHNMQNKLQNINIYTKSERIIYTYKQFEIYIELFRHSQREVYLP